MPRKNPPVKRQKKNSGAIDTSVFFGEAGPKPHETPGGIVYVHDLSGTDLLRYHTILRERPAANLSEEEQKSFTENQARKSHAFLVVTCIKDADGKPCFADMGIEGVMKMKSHLLLDLSSQVMLVAGMIAGQGAATKN